MSPYHPKLLFTLIFSILSVCVQSQYINVGWPSLDSSISNSNSSGAVSAISRNQQGNEIYAVLNNGVYKFSPPGWLALGQGPNALNPNSLIQTITTDPAGNVYAAGYFTNSSGKCYVAKWNGTSWSELGTGTAALNPTGPIYTITSDSSGNIYAAGSFIDGNGKRYVAKWNGSSWIELGTGANALNANDFINSIAADAAGNIYAGGNFANGSAKRYVAKWNGSSWSEIGGTNALNANLNILSIAVDASGAIYAGGQFTNPGNYCYVAKWNGSNWSELGTGANALNAQTWIRCVVTYGGNVYAAGDFSSVNGHYVGKWNGVAWSEVGLGGGLLAANSIIRSFTVDGGGNIFAGGDFTNFNGYKYVAKWSPSSNSWAQAGFNGSGMLTASDPKAICTDAARNVYVAGFFVNGNGNRYVAKWNGVYWSEVGNSTSALNANAGITTLATDAAGNLYAAGWFTNGTFSGNGHPYVAKWDGSSWTELGSGPTALNANGAIECIRQFGGNIYAAGYFTNANGKYYVAKWNGSGWSEMGTGANGLNATVPIHAIAVDHLGTVYAATYQMISGSDAYYIAKWNGTNWSELSNGTSFFHSDDPIMTIETDLSNNVYSIGSGIYQSNFVNYIKKWNGSAWAILGGVYDYTFAQHLNSDSIGNIYILGGNIPIVKRWNGAVSVPLGQLGVPETVVAVTADNLGNVYGCGDFTDATHSFNVARYDSMALVFPDVFDVHDQCTNSPNAKGKLANPPYNGNVTVTQDATPLTYSSIDSSFTYFVNGTTAAGGHLVRVKYSNVVNTTQKDTTYSVSAIVTPSIAISGNTVVGPGQFTNLSSTIQYGGNTPVYQWQDSTSIHTWANIPGGTQNILVYVPAPGNKVRCKLTSNASCTTTSSATSNLLTFSLATAINPVFTTAEKLRLTPNPAYLFITLDSLSISDNWKTAQIVSALGQVEKYRIDISNKQTVTIPTGELKPGYYSLVLINKFGKTATVRFIKQ